LQALMMAVNMIFDFSNLCFQMKAHDR